MTSSDEQHIAELLAGEVLGDLDDQERLELEELRSNSTDDRMELVRSELDLTAAAVQAAGVDASLKMPDNLADRIRLAGYKVITGNAANDSVSLDNQPSLLTPTETTMRTREKIAWLAVAAAIALCVGTIVATQQQTVQTAQLTDQQLRASLLQQPTALQIQWAPGKTPFDSEVTGDVVWDSASQTGVMRFVNMPVNDPSQEQYQLWIIDPERDDEPVDGGVFDISERGEVLVAIDAKLQVINPAAFAITIEKPGGVVVSTQERLPLLAAAN